MDANFNIQLYQLLREWNPMQFEDATLGDSEYYDVMDIVHQKLPRELTISKIQAIFQYSFQTTLSNEAVEVFLSKVDTLNETCQI